MKYLLVTISAEDKEQADNILNSLLKRKLVTGGLMLSSPARFLWKGEVVDIDYYNITSYALEKFKEAIIEDVRKTSVEEVPMVTFIPFEGNNELTNWIERSLS